MSEQNITPTDAPPPMPTPVPAPPKKGLAVAALVLGIVAIVGCWIPILNIGSIVIGLVGLILGIVGIIQAVKGTAGGKVMAIVGAGLSALAIIFAIVVNSAAVAAVDNALEEAGGDISASTAPAESTVAEPSDEATPAEEVSEAPTVGTIDSPAAIGDGTVWTIAQGGDEWALTFDQIQVFPGYSGGNVAVVTGTATPTAIADGDTSSWASFPIIGWMAGGATVDDTFDIPDTDALDGYRSSIELEATVGTQMQFYSTVGLPDGVTPDLMTIETLFGSDTIYFATGL